VPEGADVFRADHDPSLKLRFQRSEAGVRGYGRYHNGWFTAVARREE
jgi:hypothetical protein